VRGPLRKESALCVLSGGGNPGYHIVSMDVIIIRSSLIVRIELRLE